MNMNTQAMMKVKKIRFLWRHFDMAWMGMDGVARLEDGWAEVPGTTCYQDNVLFIVMLQGSAATAPSPSDLSMIQPVHECTANGLQV